MLGWAAVAMAQTATFDTIQEGTNAVTIADGGLLFQNYDNRYTAPPGSLAIDRAEGTLGGLPGFTPTNALGFGGYSAGTGAAFGRFGSVEITNGGLGEAAELTVFEFGSTAGLVIQLEALQGGVVVASDSAVLAGGFVAVSHTLSVAGATFDLLRLSVGPNAGDVAFVLVDTVTITPPSDTGDTGAPIDTAPPVDTGEPVDTAGPEDSGAPIDTGTPPGGTTGPTTTPGTTPTTPTTPTYLPDDDPDEKGCGCASGGRAGLAGLAVGLLALRRRRR